MWIARPVLRSLGLFLALGLVACSVRFSFGTKILSVEVTPANPTIGVGGTQQFVANVTESDGITIPFPAGSVLWGSSKPAVAIINNTGRATGVSPGTTTITATVDRVSGFTTLTVTSTAPSVSVAGGASKLEIAFAARGQGFLYVANALEDTISVFRVDVQTGEERPDGAVSVAPARGPVWLAAHPSGRFLYVVNRSSENISAFSIDPGTGRLSEIMGSPFDTGSSPWAISVDAAGQFISVTHFASAEVSLFRIDQATGALALEMNQGQQP